MVISYSYLWEREARKGQEEGTKYRPCAIVLSTDTAEGKKRVQILPVTHSPPSNDEPAIEIPAAIKRHLKLDDHPSWILTGEYNQFLWPGYDLAEVGNSHSPVYGFLPQKFFQFVIESFLVESRPKPVIRD
jgi:hypothetical protein